MPTCTFFIGISELITGDFFHLSILLFLRLPTRSVSLRPSRQRRSEKTKKRGWEEDGGWWSEWVSMVRLAWANPRSSPSRNLVYRIALFLTSEIYICRHTAGHFFCRLSSLSARRSWLRGALTSRIERLRSAGARNPRARFTEDRRFITLTCNQSRKTGRTPARTQTLPSASDRSQRSINFWRRHPRFVSRFIAFNGTSVFVGYRAACASRPAEQSNKRIKGKSIKPLFVYSFWRINRTDTCSLWLASYVTDYSFWSGESND